MIHTKKMILVPYQDGSGAPAARFNPPLTPVKRRSNERQKKIMLILLKLALHGGYDSNGKIKTTNGDHADLVPLLQMASSPGRNVKGVDDFVSLLHDAGVTPDLVINHVIREQLQKKAVEVVKHTREQGTLTEPATTVNQRTEPSKRKRVDSEANSSNKRFNFDWDQSDSDLDE